MAESDTLPPDPFASEKPLHRRMSHARVAKFQAVSMMILLGTILAFVGVLLLASLGWALIVLSALLLGAAVAAYRTLEDE